MIQIDRGENPVNKYNYLDLLSQLGIDSAHPGGFLLSKKVLLSLPINSKSRILDVGCGTGKTAAYIKKKYHCQVFAIDSSPVMIKKAKERFKKEQVNITVYKGTSEYMPFQNNTFDLILAESTTIFTDIKKTLSEYARILKKDGLLIDIDMTAQTSLKSWEYNEIISYYGLSMIPTEQEWIKKFNEAGFDSVRIMYGGSVFSAIFQNMIPNRNQKLLSSKKLNAALQDLWLDHQRLTLKYGHVLGYRVFIATKSFKMR